MAVAVSRATLNGITYELSAKPNENANDGVAKRVHKWAGTAYGAWRLTQLPHKIGDVAAEIGSLAGASAEALLPIRETSKVFRRAADGMIFAYTLWTAGELAEQVGKVSKDGSAENVLELGRRSLEFITSGCHSLSSFWSGARSALGKTALVTELTADVIESYQAAAEWCKTDALLAQRSNLSEDVQAGLQSEKTLHLISLAKSVIAIAIGVFGVLGLFFGIAVVPSVVLLTMGLATCSLAYVKHFFQENMATFINREVVALTP